MTTQTTCNHRRPTPMPIRPASEPPTRADPSRKHRTHKRHLSRIKRGAIALEGNRCGARVVVNGRRSIVSLFFTHRSSGIARARSEALRTALTDNARPYSMLSCLAEAPKNRLSTGKTYLRWHCKEDDGWLSHILVPMEWSGRQAAGTRRWLLEPGCQLQWSGHKWFVCGLGVGHVSLADGISSDQGQPFVIMHRDGGEHAEKHVLNKPFATNLEHVRKPKDGGEQAHLYADYFLCALSPSLSLFLSCPPPLFSHGTSRLSCSQTQVAPVKACGLAAFAHIKGRSATC